MLYLLLSICCSVIVSVIIKVGRAKGINTQQLVLWNYPITVLLSWVLLQPDFSSVQLGQLPFHFYIPLAVLLPTMFIFIALAIQYSGIVKTDIAQRLSLVIPLAASFLLFGESLADKSLIGVLVGLIAVAFSVSWQSSSTSSNHKAIFYPLVVFLGMGGIDILFKQVTQYSREVYFVSLFIVFTLAMLVAFGILLYKLYFKHEQLDRRAILWGLGMGFFNFANIFLYMKAHRLLKDNPSVVFTTMDVGGIVLGGIVGMVFFKERLSLLNKIGLGLAIFSVLLIYYL
ncbi:EamA/RhaT family transporter [Parapedobacter sp. SGR-10]|uniref:EamA family transporter n=1 Tax=Parapedobacter sp. SGR-10 TaxID=2710879 RepID=UPI0013D0C4F9|nr:EamA/RhaT family transporter [Parapedobacter sp. SGR-10]NGF58038.1 EamA/RhaT family transporter [Parapedobacter sp. SGR-10]